MINKQQSKTKAFVNNTVFLLIGISFAILFWIFESYNHFIHYREMSFWRELISPNPHELWMRTIIVILFLLFGVSTQMMFKKVKTAEYLTMRAYAELDQIFQTAADGMRVIDNKFNIIRVNETFLKLTGLPLEKVVGKKCYEVFSGSKCDTKDCPLTLILKGVEHVEYEAEKTQPNGNKIPCIVAATPFRDENSQLIGIVEDFKDISLLKNAEMESAKLEEELRHTRKMEAIGTLAGGIAHDFNNILNGIMTYARLLGTQPLTEEQNNYIDEIVKGGKQATGLVRQILSFSKSSEHKQQPLNIYSVVEEAIKFLESSLPTTIELRKTLDPNVGTVMGDESQIYQVVINLCTNAYQAMRETTGILEVRLDQVTEAPSKTDRTINPDRYPHIRLVVKDSGHGMNSYTQERIFDPYFTTKEQGEGTGLGLTTAQGIIMSHNGSISVKSAPGAGAEFTVYFPVISKELIVNDPPKEIVRPHTGKGRILFVDDADYNTRSGKLVLEAMGYSVTALNDSVEALSVFLENPYSYDIIITDQTMPKKTGLELSKDVLKTRNDMPIIMITGHSDIVDKEQALAVGISDFFYKPLDIDKLVESITALINVTSCRTEGTLSQKQGGSLETD